MMVKLGRVRRDQLAWPGTACLRVVAACLCLLAVTPVDAGQLVVSPHPEDDIIFAAGVIYRSVGIDEVTVVHMTNGDFNGVSSGLARQAEAVNANVNNLGTTEDNLIFLGYPENWLREIFTNYQSPTSQFFTPGGQGVTYGNRGLGRADYHTFRFGSAAPYNYANLVSDLDTIIDTYRPSHIYTTSEYDTDWDHKITYRSVKAAVASVRARSPLYNPVIHSTIIWSADPNGWPTASDPRQPLTQIPGLTSTPLEWTLRESLDVPVALRNPNLLVNPKFRAFQAHVGKARGERTAFIERWAHKDEIFWAESSAAGNAPPVAEAGTDITTTSGSIVTLDGSRSRDPEGVPVMFNWSQRTGPLVTLDDPAAMFPRFTVPTSLAQDVTWSFDLKVSDGVLSSAADTVTVLAAVQTQNIANLAAVTASSESPATGQLAIRAVDGVIGGNPETDGPEWKTASEGAGAWIRLSWPSQVVIDRIRLFDRPHWRDQITGATLSFSDGSTVPVGPLDNDARTGTLISFPARTVSSVTLTVTSVSSTNRAAGLAEIQVFGQVLAVPDTTPPSVPGNLAVSGTTTTTVALSWSAATDAGGSGLAGYRIYRDGSATALSTVTGTTFTDTGLTPGTSHNYAVTAYDAAGNESAAAGPVNGTTQAAADTTPPSVPGNLAVSSTTTTTVGLSWSASTDAGGSGLVGYRIYRDGSTTALSTVTGTTFTDAGLAPGTSHSYTVTAYDVAGNESAAAGPVNGTTQALPDTTPPSVPGNLAVSGTTTTTVGLSWSASTDEGGSGLAGYRIYRDGGATALNTVTGTTFTDTGLTPGTSHNYTVTAYDVAGNESVAAGPVTGTTQLVDTAPPSVPGNLAVSGTTTTTVGLSWSASIDAGGSGLAGYRIYRDGLQAGTVSGVNPTVISFDAIAGSDTIYTTATFDGFQFVSQHFHLFAPYGHYASNGTPYMAYESYRGFPITMTAVDGGSFALLGFDAAEGVPANPIDHPPAEAIGVEGTRADGTTVTAVVTLDGLHDGSAQGSANDFQAFALEPSLTNLISVRFYGIRNDGREGGIALDNIVVVSGGSAAATTFTDTGLTPGTSHSYTVTAYDAAGNESAAAGPVNGTTQAAADTTPPSVPGNLAVSGTTTTTVALGWSASTDAGGSGLAGYRIYRDGSTTALSTVTGTTFTDAGLAPGTSHNYTVTAYDVAGNESAAAGPVNGTTQVAGDTTPPSVVAQLPASGATGIAFGAAVTVTFSEPMNASTINGSTMELRDSANQAVPAVVAYSTATSAATLMPLAPLSAASSYTVMVRGGASIPSVADLAGNALGSDVSWTFATAPPRNCTGNSIVLENCLPGNPSSEWQVTGSGDSTIQGFSTDISVNKGEVVRFKVRSDALNYRVDIYRLGYYDGLGARRVATVVPSASLPQSQPNCLVQSATGLVDCGNWAISAAWDVPATAVSGVYVARLVRGDNGGASHIPFIVRDDTGAADILFQTADTTWQAYNDYGGNSLYLGQPAGRAYMVSYNRPFSTRAIKADSYLFNAEYPMIRWLEANGYRVSYTSGVDSDRRGQQIPNHRLFMSNGHDEYWSGSQRAHVEAARDAGVNLAFFSGNEVFWKIRWESSIDGSGSPYRTMVCYKETHANSKIDPSPTWTGTWRDPRFSPPADGGRPENQLTGTIFRVNAGATTSIVVPADEGRMRFWRGTSVATLPVGSSATMPFGTLGYEWDEDADNGFRPAGLFRLSSTTVSGAPVLQDWGSTYASGMATHSLTMYRAPSGALVFGAGTIQWAWGLDSVHDRGNAAPDPRMQQATVNLLADMGIQPDSLRPGLALASASTDSAPPTSTIVTPADGGSVTVGQLATVSGTATDAGGGIVGGVEVSTDGGTVWRRANGRGNWSYSWVPANLGQVNILARAVDDSGNIETPGAGRLVNVVAAGASCPCSVWDLAAVPSVASSSDSGSVELGVKFRSSVSGYVTGIRFHKGMGNTGTHTGSLWSAAGVRLATATFTNETESGWQQVSFATPVPISANTVYVASYLAPRGRFSYDRGYFAAGGILRGPLYLLRDGESGGNGVYVYGSGGQLPSSSYLSTNYWVDVVFETDMAANTPPVLANPGNQSGTVGAAVNLQLAATDANNDPLSFSATGLPAGLSISATGLISGTLTTAETANVTAVVSDGRGGTDTQTFSWTIQLLPDTAPPSVPGNLGVSGTSMSSVALGWNASTDTGGSGLAGYRIYRNGSATALSTVTGTTFTDTGLAAGTSYSYVVTAYDVAGNESAAAGPVIGTTQVVADTTAPTVPSGVSISKVTGNPQLTWSASTDNVGVTQYAIHRSTNGTVGPEIARSSATNWVDTAVQEGIAYSYAVSALDAAGNRSATSAIRTITAGEPPTNPSNLVVVLVNRQPQLTWTGSTDNVGVVGYIIYRSTNGSLGPEVARTPNTTWLDTSALVLGTRYTYAVKAYDAAGLTSGRTNYFGLTVQ